MEYSSTENVLSSVISGATTLVFGLLFIILILLVVVTIAEWKMFKKAGKHGWECLIPIYGSYVLTEIAGVNWWWFLLSISNSIVTLLGVDSLSSISSLVSLFAGFNIFYNVAKKFNKSNSTAVLAGLFSFVYILIFGLSKNEVYNKDIPVSKNGIF